MQLSLFIEGLVLALIGIPQAIIAPTVHPNTIF
jgi:hypothetical protein